MKYNRQFFKKRVMSLCGVALLATPNISAAHLMLMQHGTLNFVGDNAYLVLSLPISAFTGLDDNADKRITIQEFNEHRHQITSQVKSNIYLMDNQKRVVIDGLLLNPDVAHQKEESYRHSAGDSIEQVTIMGHYELSSSQAETAFHVALFSNDVTRQYYEVVATNKQKKLVHEFEVKPNQQSIKVFN